MVVALGDDDDDYEQPGDHPGTRTCVWAVSRGRGEGTTALDAGQEGYGTESEFG